MNWKFDFSPLTSDILTVIMRSLVDSAWNDFAIVKFQQKRLLGVLRKIRRQGSETASDGTHWLETARIQHWTPACVFLF